MTARQFIGALGFCLGTAASASAGPVDSYSSLVILGDSYSDTGRIFADIGFPNPTFFFDGTFADGPIHADRLAEDVTAAGGRVHNLAYGGANIVNDPDDRPRDLADQLNDLSVIDPAKLGPDPLLLVFLGINDVSDTARRSNLDDLPGIADALIAEIAGLADDGFRDVALLNVPDLSGSPRYNPAIYADPADDLASRIADGTARFNAALAAGLAGFDPRQAVTIVDIAALFRDIAGTPTDYGLTDIQRPCLYNTTAIANRLGEPDRFCGTDARNRLWFDGLHPSSTVHDAMYETVVDALVPVPVHGGTAGLIVAISGLGLLARGRRRRPRA